MAVTVVARQEHQAGNALDALAKLSQPEVSVMRGGEVTSIPTVPRWCCGVPWPRVGHAMPWGGARAAWGWNDR